MHEDAIKVFVELGFTDIEMRANPIEVTSYDNSYPDPDWQFTDAQGHHHYRSPREGKHYPTLVTVIDCEATDDYNEEWHYECVICGEHIEPGYKDDRNGYRTFVQGPIDCIVALKDGRTLHLSYDQVQEIRALSELKYDYQFTKLREYLTKLNNHQS